MVSLLRETQQYLYSKVNKLSISVYNISSYF